jgi:hypothetical protein
MKIHESLNQYRDYKFFSLLEKTYKSKKLVEGFNVKPKTSTPRPDTKSGAQKESEKEIKDPKNAQKQLEAKEQAQAAKDAQDIVKKARENFGRFKSFAGNQIGEYKNFWDMQKKVRQAVSLKDPSFRVIYAMFNDGTSNKYNPNYVIALKNAQGKFVLTVIKSQLDGEEKNPIISISNKEASKEFVNFFKEIKNEMKSAKEHYIKTIETKKREEEHKKKREKLDKLLKESKNEKDNIKKELKTAVLDFSGTGEHWNNNKVEIRQKQLIKKYSEDKNLINNVFDLIGDISNINSELESGPNEEDEIELEKEHDKLDKKLDKLLKENKINESEIPESEIEDLAEYKVTKLPGDVFCNQFKLEKPDKTLYVVVSPNGDYKFYDNPEDGFLNNTEYDDLFR